MTHQSHHQSATHPHQHNHQSGIQMILSINVMISVPHDSIPNELLCCELPRSTHKVVTVQESMLRARVLLQNLKILTYNFSDKNVSLAPEFTHKLDEIYQCFYSKLPDAAGIIILPDPQNSLCSTKRREHVNRNTEFTNLPPRKSTKKAQTAGLV